MLKKRGRKIWGLSLSFLCFSTSSTATASSPSEGPKGNGKLYGISPDKFVQASPLVMAAVCRDGVAVVAAHTSDEDEPLLYYSPAGADKPAAEDGDYLDLPDTFAGPFRIHAIDAFGTTMLASGWRADCDEIVARARDLSSAEVQRYGPPISGSMSYARYLTAELSLFMALCVVSEGLRPLSTVGLLVFPKGQEDRDHPPLWLVDGTGAYPVRAICVGGGLDAKTGKPVAQIIQSRMQRKTDFAEMSLEECAKSLLNLLLSEDDAQDETSEPLLKRGTRLEIAGVGDGKRFIRIPFAGLQPALEQ